jgi:plastocyanin
MSRRSAVGVVFGLLLCLQMVTGAAAADPRVEISDGAFTPKEITIRAGQVVTWQNATSTAHTVVADDGSFDSGELGLNDQFANVFPEPGRYGYHDATDPSMTGVVVVKAAKPTASPKGSPGPTPPAGTLPPELNTSGPTPPSTPPPSTPASAASAAATAQASGGGAPTPGPSVPAGDPAAAGSGGAATLLMALLIVAIATVVLGVVVVRRYRAQED